MPTSRAPTFFASSLPGILPLTLLVLPMTGSFPSSGVTLAGKYRLLSPFKDPVGFAVRLEAGYLTHDEVDGLKQKLHGTGINEPADGKTFAEEVRNEIRLKIGLNF
jgi:hypothetical protein